ncbi:MAG: stage II sporulation protein M [Peptococcaceae bacterium]|nr:MAG: stage II sporulation protein M [Peptococcaceae bacterium]
MVPVAKSLKDICLASLRHYWPVYLVVFLIFGLGVTAGAIAARNLEGEQAGELSRYLDSFLQQVNALEIDQPVAVKDAVTNNVLIILAIYFLGLTIIGIPVMLALVFTRGFALGFASGFLTQDRALRGVVLVFAAIFPQNLFFVPALVVGGVASLSFAVLLARRFQNSYIKVWPGFLGYTGLMLMVLAAAIFAGLIEVYLTPLLVKLVASIYG